MDEPDVRGRFDKVKEIDMANYNGKAARQGVQDEDVQGSQEEQSSVLEALRMRVRETVRQCERFSWLADEMRDEVANLSLEELRDMLLNPESHVPTCERALIGLALSGRAEAGPIIEAWGVEGRPERLELLRRIALIEWEHRFQRTLALAYVQAGASPSSSVAIVEDDKDRCTRTRKQTDPLEAVETVDVLDRGDENRSKDKKQQDPSASRP
jgi:hypothetical protein